VSTGCIHTRTLARRASTDVQARFCSTHPDCREPLSECLHAFRWQTSAISSLGDAMALLLLLCCLVDSNHAAAFVHRLARNRRSPSAYFGWKLGSAARKSTFLVDIETFSLSGIALIERRCACACGGARRTQEHFRMSDVLDATISLPQLPKRRSHKKRKLEDEAQQQQQQRQQQQELGGAPPAKRVALPKAPPPPPPPPSMQPIVKQDDGMEIVLM
jgi:hypothetical protein